jgi:hypothetical protein
MKAGAAYECVTDTWPEDCQRIYELEGKNRYELHGSRATATQK